MSFFLGNIPFLNELTFHQDTKTRFLQSVVLSEAFKQIGKYFLFLPTVSIGKEMPSSKEVCACCLSHIANKKCFQATHIPVSLNYKIIFIEVFFKILAPLLP